MKDLDKLKRMIDEDNYPYFSTTFLLKEMENLSEDYTIDNLAKDLCIVKSSIPPIKLGDVEIPSPKEYFLRLASNYRKYGTRNVGRTDEY